MPRSWGFRQNIIQEKIKNTDTNYDHGQRSLAEKKDKQKQTTILKSLITDKYYQAH